MHNSSSAIEHCSFDSKSVGRLSRPSSFMHSDRSFLDETTCPRLQDSFPTHHFLRRSGNTSFDVLRYSATQQDEFSRPKNLALRNKALRPIEFNTGLLLLSAHLFVHKMPMVMAVGKPNQSCEISVRDSAWWLSKHRPIEK